MSIGLLIFVIVAAVIAAFVVYAWNNEAWRAWFKDSETLVWARVQMGLGGMGSLLALLGTVFSAQDLSPLFATGMPSGRQLVLFGFTFLQGLVTELLRRRREPGL